LIARRVIIVEDRRNRGEDRAGFWLAHGTAPFLLR
jgi:hypothetical protein